MPRISAPTVAENRAQRRAALLTAGSALLRRDGTVTMADVAAEVGLSRSAVYEYYASAADLVADLLDRAWADTIQAITDATAHAADPGEQVQAWVRAALGPSGGSRRALVRAAGSDRVPPPALLPLREALAALGCPDPDTVAQLTAAVADAALDAVAAGQITAPEAEDLTVQYVRGATGLLATVTRDALPPTHP